MLGSFLPGFRRNSPYGPTSSGIGPTSSGLCPTSSSLGPTISWLGLTSSWLGPTSSGFGPHLCPAWSTSFLAFHLFLSWPHLFLASDSDTSHRFGPTFLRSGRTFSRLVHLASLSPTLPRLVPPPLLGPVLLLFGPTFSPTWSLLFPRGLGPLPVFGLVSSGFVPPPPGLVPHPPHWVHLLLGPLHPGLSNLIPLSPTAWARVHLAPRSGPTPRLVPPFLALGPTCPAWSDLPTLRSPPPAWSYLLSLVSLSPLLLFLTSSRLVSPFSSGWSHLGPRWVLTPLRAFFDLLRLSPTSFLAWSTSLGFGPGLRPKFCSPCLPAQPISLGPPRPLGPTPLRAGSTSPRLVRTSPALVRPPPALLVRPPFGLVRLPPGLVRPPLPWYDLHLTWSDLLLPWTDLILALSDIVLA
ncbi:hypothetical protein FNV43_RR04634 [Rhamnella rubrinervis]|uniref:Uncharacterized protein n=1 Tax=Rhamnella rubrinervis TaxID=2594499 RepID=A0A8K0HJY5_9ROSA|nr:hypothetical protein FNV43_RR04634 [Rhamnella rubrinervis]